MLFKMNGWLGDSCAFGSYFALLGDHASLLPTAAATESYYTTVLLLLYQCLGIIIISLAHIIRTIMRYEKSWCAPR